MLETFHLNIVSSFDRVSNILIRGCDCKVWKCVWLFDQLVLDRIVGPTKTKHRMNQMILVEAITTLEWVTLESDLTIIRHNYNQLRAITGSLFNAIQTDP